MSHLVLIVLNLISLALTLICGIAAITISAAILTGKLEDPEAWMAAVLLAVTGGVFWMICHATRDLTEQD